MPSDDYPQLKLLKEDSKSAFEYLYNQYCGKLYGFISRITHGNTWQTEELVQRTFIKVWENRKTINPDKSFLSYLCVIAKNMLLNEIEHQMVEFIFSEYFKHNETVVDYSTDKGTDYIFLEKLISQLADQLPPARKQIFLLRKQKNYSVKEIAKELNLAETTVQTQLSKALAFMRKQLSQHYGLVPLFLFFHT
jgi:RNA polymerase sigma-70 factor (ECF subfamily)